MDVYAEALAWANQRGDSGGAQRMRQLVLSLYNHDFYAYSVGDAIAGLDAQGRGIAMACLREYASLGESKELVRVGEQIRASGMLTGWFELCKAAYGARAEVRRRWSLEATSDTGDRD